MSQPPTHKPQTTLSNPTGGHQQLIFDFTKRKRWADLLIAELTEAIMLVLSQTGQVWFCGPAVEELLGWKDEEVTDVNFCDIMNPNDRPTFQRQFAEAIQNRTDMLAYARLQCKTAKDLYPNVPAPQAIGMGQGSDQNKPAPKEILFEINGYAHYVSASSANAMGTRYRASEIHNLSPHDTDGGIIDDDKAVFQCFFAVAKPYPSRNTAMLNTFLELKMENERLQARLQAAKAKAENIKLSPMIPSSLDSSASSPSAVSSPTQPSYAQSGPTFTYSYSTHGPRSASSEAGSYKPYDTPLAGPSSAFAQVQEDDADVSGDPSLPRKKNKRATGDMYVCMACGRTDSPEWRKGPQGPKTLCNACGLRWAKSNRGPKEGTNATASGSGSSSHNSMLAFGVGAGAPTTSAEPSSSNSSIALASPVAADNMQGRATTGAGAPHTSAASDYGYGMNLGRGGMRWS